MKQQISAMQFSLQITNVLPLTYFYCDYDEKMFQAKRLNFFEKFYFNKYDIKI